MIDRVLVAKMLDGWRGTPAVDRAALVAALIALSAMADRLPSLEINPAFVTRTGIIGADHVVEVS